MADLRPGQNRRIGRIAENNPERAKVIAARMENRANNKTRKEDKFIKKSELRLTRKDRGEKIADAVKNKRPDTPLAATPEPITDSNRKERLNDARSRSELGPKIINFFKNR